MYAAASNRRNSRRRGDRAAGRARCVRTSRRAAWYEWLALAFVVLLLTYAVVVWAQPHDGLVHERAAAVHVANGDTLWSLARAHPVPGLSTAQTVDLIRAINGRTDAAIQAGEVLLIPGNTSHGVVAAR